PLAALVFTLTAASFTLLAASFLNTDFSLTYVAGHAHSLLPWYYKISAVWGGHEGSMLLWMAVLAGWTLALALQSRHLPQPLATLTLATQAALACGVLLFILLTSNPFARLPLPAAEGADLNPLLQDIGLILHPPLLYMGYVGLSVPFSFALAALLLGRFDSTWAAHLRPWVNTAWAFLTLGIALGSAWAYYELGWGGWWFWDPVENASLMPWLLATALLHSLAVSAKRNLFHRWTLLLATMAFSLSLLGTFLVRSGILTSVHAFASDPDRGLFILLFLSLVTGGSLTLYALRTNHLKTTPDQNPPDKGGLGGLKSSRSSWIMKGSESSANPPPEGFTPLSRETGLLLNNLLLVLMCAVVLLGTLYPLFIELLNLGSVSVGPPYFNLFAALLFIPMAILLAPTTRLNWRRNSPRRLLALTALPLFLATTAALALSLTLANGLSLWLILGGGTAVWIGAHTLADLKTKLTQSPNWRTALHRLTPSYWGMQLAHLGVAVCLVGILFSAALSETRDLRLTPGDSHSLAGYQFHLHEYRQRPGPNYQATEAEIHVSQAGRQIATLRPQKRRYVAGDQIMTEAGIHGTLSRDLYATMGEPLDENAWAVRLQVKPFIRCIWLGTLLMAAGALLSLTDRRRRRHHPTYPPKTLLN
ncbi:MAG: heme lyase CcmF/NrfE family subunit, partial [Cellvibrionales bacterium]|nr:heme lyase CcmF/NrfE family subunit [Cellvibrionales bacterium]